MEIGVARIDMLWVRNYFAGFGNDCNVSTYHSDPNQCDIMVTPLRDTDIDIYKFNSTYTPNILRTDSIFLPDLTEYS